MPGVGFLTIEIPPSAHPLASQLSFFMAWGSFFFSFFTSRSGLQPSATCLCDPLTVFYSQLACAVPEFAGTEEMAKFIGVSVWLKVSIKSVLDTYNDQAAIIGGSILLSRQKTCLSRQNFRRGNNYTCGSSRQ